MASRSAPPGHSPRLTRYVLGELLRPFLFFVLVFTGVVWLAQSLRVVDMVVASGEALVFLEFSALLMPRVMSIVLPLSAFGAALYAVNKLFADSEIVAMLAAGMSGAALARPVALFGAIVTVATGIVTLWLQPAASTLFRDRVAEIRADVANALVMEGRFLHPADGLTVFVRRNEGGEALSGVFVHDRRGDGEVTYSARQAVLSRTEEGPRLLMIDGQAQRLEKDGGVSLLRFDSLVYDLSPFVENRPDRRRAPSERNVLELVAPTVEQLEGFSLGRFLSEGHEQLSAPLYALALPLVGAAGILGFGFSRRGYAMRIAAAAGAGAGLRLVGFLLKSATTADAGLWPLMYAPPVLGVAVALFVLERGGRLPRLRREPPAVRAVSGGTP